MSNLFTEIRFDPGVIPKGTGEYTFSTIIIRTHFDAGRRNCIRHDWLFTTLVTISKYPMFYGFY